MITWVRIVALLGVLAILGLAAAGLARRSPPPAAAVTVLVPDSPQSEAGTAPLPDLVARKAVRRARRWAAGRAGEVAFAVLERGALHGWNRHLAMPSASLSKAMMLAAALREGALTGHLAPMVTQSDNDAADVVYAQVGGAGLADVARAAGMTHFADGGHWAVARLTAADQVRFFAALDRVVPRRHRGYARRLLRSIVPWQAWGIARVARHEGLRAYFKGGWRTDVVHQAALVEGHGRQAAIAVLTRGSPSFDYAVATIEGVARRLID